MSDVLSPEPPLEAQRVPLEREVVLQFEHFSNFIKEYSANISLGGMFIKTPSPRLRGTVFRFQIRLTDDEPLVAGLGKVLWIRTRNEGADRPAGMGIRFLRLEEQGRQLIERIVQEHVERGGQAFDPTEPPGAGSAAGAAEAPAAQGSAERRKSATPQPPSATSEPPPAAPRSKVELPPLEELLAPEQPKGALHLDTPPRGWKPGTFAVRPRTRPQLLATIAVAAVVVAGLVYLLLHIFAAPPELKQEELTPPQLPLPQEPEPAPEPEEPRFTALEEISFRRQGDAAEITIRVDGSIAEASWSETRLTDPPRQLIQLLGVTRAYPTRNFDLGYGGVRQIRTGYHSQAGGDQQHLVIDLLDPRVALQKVEVQGRELRLRFRRVNP